MSEKNQANRCWINGVEQSDAKVLVSDRGLNYGMAIFETLLADQRGCLAIDFHLQRFKRGAKRLGIPLPADSTIKQWWQQAAMACDVASESPAATVKCLLTEGSGARGYASPKSANSQLIVLSAPHLSAPQSLNLITAGERLVSSNYADIKHNHKVAQVLAKNQALTAGADDAVMLDNDGYVIEATSSNLLAWTGEEWVTPSLRAAGLPGTALQRITTQVSVRQAIFTEAEFAAYPEIYCCNAIIGAVPIERWQGRRYTSSQRSNLLAALAATA